MEGCEKEYEAFKAQKALEIQALQADLAREREAKETEMTWSAFYRAEWDKLNEEFLATKAELEALKAAQAGSVEEPSNRRRREM